jgi:hypothetical protein
MKLKQIVLVGTPAGLTKGISLFIIGAVAARLIYGPQFAPEGKFKPEQINAWYFIWTKLVIGIFFGLVFTALDEALPLSRRIQGVLDGLKYAFWFWLVIQLWDVSHPLVYGSLKVQDQVFWLVYTLGGFLGYGIGLGLAYRKYGSAPPNPSVKPAATGSGFSDG